MAVQSLITFYYYSCLYISICLATVVQCSQICDSQLIIVIIIPLKKHHNNECWLKKRTWMIGRDDVNTFVSSSGSQFKWLHQFWNLHSNSLWLTYSKFRPNIISKTKNNDIQLFSTSPFTRQSELVKLELYFTLYTWIYTWYAIYP